jgi:hypothetical protein
VNFFSLLFSGSIFKHKKRISFQLLIKFWFEMCKMYLC